MESSSSSRDEALELAQRLIKSLLQDEKIIERLQSYTLTETSIDRDLRARLQADFSTEVSGGQVDKVINIAKAGLVQFISDTPEPKKLERQNIPRSDVEFFGRELELEILHQQLKQKGRVIIYSEKDSPGKTELARQYADIAWQKQIYPGGVCWLQGHDIPLGRQIVNFAKSKLGLYLPENKDLQSQIDYCWSHWPEGNVLIVLDNIQDYQQVKSYLYCREKRFKFLCTTPRHSLNESGFDKNFEHLLLSISTKELRDDFRGNYNESNFSYVFFIIIFLLLFFSGFSLCLSYITFGSLPWLEEYKEYGYIIEFIRTIIFLGAEVCIVFIVFRKEYCEFFGLKLTAKEYMKATKLTRFFMIGVTIATLVLVVHYHLSLAPQNLADIWNSNHPEYPVLLNSEKGFKWYKLPYLWYLIYSLINYILIWVPIVSVTIFSAIKDCIFLGIYREELKYQQNKIATLRDWYSFLFSKKNICDKVARNFTIFSSNFIAKIGNYTTVFLGFGIGVTFEVVIGRVTLADQAIVWLGLGYFLWAFALFIILLAYGYYENALQESVRLLLEFRCPNSDDFKKRNKTASFIKKLFDTYLNLYLGIIIIVIALIVASLSKVLD